MTYRAKTNIYAGPGVLAYAAGDVVPDDAVTNLGVEDKVSHEGKRPARRAPRRAPKPAPDEPETDADAGTASADS